MITEVAYLLASRLGTRAELLFLAGLASGAFGTEAAHPADWPRITELVARYWNFPLGTVDASVVACAERLGAHEGVTLDHRRFGAVRPAHTEVFTLLP